MPEPLNLPPALRDRLRSSHNEMIAALAECYGPDAPIIQELGGYDLTLPSDADVPPGTNAWYEDFLESEKE